MVGVGVTLDVALYHRVFAYQPGWVALPLGALELVLVVSLAGPVGIMAPLGPALALFAATWLLAQVLGHAAFPWLRLSYAEDGGELGRLGAPAVAAAAADPAGRERRCVRDPAADRDAARGRRQRATRDHAGGDARRQAGHGRDAAASSCAPPAS